MVTEHRSAARVVVTGGGSKGNPFGGGYLEDSNTPTSEQVSYAGVDLRPYQREVIDRLRRTTALGERCPLLVAPTGAGKTVIASAVVKGAVQRGSRVLFLAHRRELIQQAAQKLWHAAGIDAGIVMAGYPPRPDQLVQVASVQTLWHRAHRSSAIDSPEADLVVVDEVGWGTVQLDTSETL
jgi:superfamily II DNA or RNA helicase